MDVTALDKDVVDKLPLASYLLVEVLVARHRLGEQVWTFPVKRGMVGHLVRLEVLGLVGWKHGVVERTFLAWLTDRGKAAAMSTGYVPPILAMGS